MINIEVYSTHAVIRSQQPLTVGLTGASAHFAFGKPWDQLIKTAVFRQGEKTVTVADIGQQVQIPWEVLTLPGVPVMIGVYGTDPEGKLVIPTLWAETEPVRPGADPQEGVTPADPTAPVWAQLQSNMGSREQLQTNDKTSLVAAINEANRAVCWVKVSRKEDGAYYIDGTNVPALLNAFSDGKTLICDLSGALMPLTGYSSTGLFEFTSIRNNTKYCVTILPDGTVTYTNTVLATNQSKLPNPQKLTFIGNATAEYDGSEAVSVGIPTKVSQLQNDSGFLTEVLAPLYLVTINDSGKAEQSYDDRMAAYQSGYVIQCDYLGTRLPLKAVVDMDFMFSGIIDRTSYHVVVRSNGSTVINERSLASQTDIPTKVSDLEDAGDYLTEAPVTSVNGQTGAVAVSTAIKVEVWQKNDGSYDYSHNSLRIMNALSAGNTVFCQLGTHYLLSLVYATPAKCIFTGVYEGELYAVTVTSTGATVTTTPLSSGGGGSDGITPHIGANGNWWIGEEDTGVSAGATDEQISGAVEEYLEENPLVKTVNGTVPDENGNVVLDIPSGGGSSESGAFYFTVILEEGVSSVNLLFPVNWGRMIQFNIHADAMGNSLTADMALETEVGGSYANRGTLTPDFKALDYYGIRYMWNNGYTWFATGTNTATNAPDLAVPTLGTWRPAPGNNKNNFRFTSRTDGVMFPKGMRFDVWGVYAP